MRSERRGIAPTTALAVDIAVLTLAKIAAGVIAIHAGFSHVSDDDYARVTIAESFVAHPSIDPSGTSWLPFPFLTSGGAMMLLGRSLETAQHIAFAIGILAAVLPYLAARAAKVSRWPALAGALVIALTPWDVWLGVSTVPEALTASLVACGVITLISRATSARARTLGAIALFFACLSRYEAWPMAACAAAWLFAREFRENRPAFYMYVPCIFAILGPLFWLAWNAHAHGDALHFFARVSRFRRAAGQANDSLATSLLLYPRAFSSGAPDILLLLAAGLGVAAGDRGIRAKWAGAWACVLACFAFLALGAMNDGAPTHHPARALVSAFAVVSMCGADSIATALRSREARATRGALVMISAMISFAALLSDRRIFTLENAPGTSAAEDRAPQISMGHDLRALHASGFTLVPCAYEHFATIAAFGAPELVTIAPPSGDALSDACPGLQIEPK